MADEQSAVAVARGVAVMGIPRSAELVWAFSHPPERSLGAVHPILVVARDLARRHAAQWSAEDVCRDNSADDGLVAKAKRQIDVMNAARTVLVDRIDSLPDVSLEGDAGVSLHTETLGQLVDRLAVAWVRSRKLAESAGQHPGQRSDARRALTLLAQLCDGYDDLVRDLREGRRRLPVWRSLKRYGTRR
jgi:hypothetical protein